MINRNEYIYRSVNLITMMVLSELNKHVVLHVHLDPRTSFADDYWHCAVVMREFSALCCIHVAPSTWRGDSTITPLNSSYTQALLRTKKNQ